jgi:hypothetical protein
MPAGTEWRPLVIKGPLAGAKGLVAGIDWRPTGAEGPEGKREAANRYRRSCY